MAPRQLSLAGSMALACCHTTPAADVLPCVPMHQQGLAQLAQPAWKRNPNERQGANRSSRRK